MKAEWPLVGREAELRLLGTLITGGGATGGAVIVGAPGVGKTRLLKECLPRAERAGIPCLRAQATRAASLIPFGALGALLPAGPTGERIENSPVLMSRLGEALVERAGGVRFVLVVDDAHLLDAASAALILQLASTDAACVLITARAGQEVPDAIVALWKEGLAGRIELGGLDPGAGEFLLETVLGGPVDPAGVLALMHRCGGNLLFFRELVDAALAAGTLHDDDGIWRLSGPPPLCPDLVDLLEREMGPIDVAEREVLEAVAFAQVLGPAELAAVARPEVVDDLVRRGLLSSRMDRRRVEVQVAAPLHADLLRSRMPAVRLPQIARALLQTVEAAGSRRREDSLRVAAWSFTAGERRPELMLAAAHTARWRYDFPLAERLAEAASDDGAGFDAALLRAQLACLRGRAADAAHQLTCLAEEADDDEQRGMLAAALIDTLAVYKGWMSEGLRLADRVEAGISDFSWRDEIAARRAVLVFATEGPRSSVELATAIVDRAKGRGLVWGCMGAAFGLARLGRIDEALAMTERGYTEHLALSQPIDRYPWIHAWLECEALVQAGRLLDAEAKAQACYVRGVEDASAEAQAYFAWHLATVVGDRGHVQTAVRYAREAIALNRELGRPHYERECLVGLAYALALAGHARPAAQALATLDALDLPDAMFKPLELALARGWTAVAGGDLDGASGLFRTAVADARRRGDLVGEAAALHSQARIGRPGEVLKRLEKVAERIEGELGASRARHVRALVEANPATLLDVSEGFEAMGADLLAAEAAADAAVLLRRSGAARRATGAQRRVDELRARCEGALTPSLQAVGIRVPLTRSERRAAVLATGGRSNREIAAALCLSVRTVENHLQRVYEKLGIGGRAELAGALGSDPEGAEADS